MTSGTDHFAISIKSDELVTPSDRVAYAASAQPILDQLDQLDRQMSAASAAAATLRGHIHTGGVVKIEYWTRLMAAHADLRTALSTLIDDEVLHLVRAHFVSGREAGRAAGMAPATVSRLIAKSTPADDPSE